jgi:hypothetical protein
MCTRFSSRYPLLHPSPLAVSSASSTSYVRLSAARAPPTACRCHNPPPPLHPSLTRQRSGPLFAQRLSTDVCAFSQVATQPAFALTSHCNQLLLQRMVTYPTRARESRKASSSSPSRRSLYSACANCWLTPAGTIIPAKSFRRQ